jgi:Spy/CpxP family protein refolding chaperone
MVKRTLTATLILAAFAVVAFAGPGEGRMDRRERGLARCIDLSDSQKDAIRSLREQERVASQPIRDELQATAREYKRLADKDDPAAASLLAKIHNLRDQLAARRIALRAEIEDVFTPQQRAQIEQCREERRGRR